MNRAEEKRERLARSHPEVRFVTSNGRAVKLVFDRSEYRAYCEDKYSPGKWKDMHLGSLSTDVLKEYILRNEEGVLL